MKRSIFILFIAGFTIFLLFMYSGCSSNYRQDYDYEILEFTSISRDTDSSVTEQRQLVIRNQEELEKIWQNINAIRESVEIDFTKEMVVAVFMGEKPTGGYSVEITSIYEYGDRIVVNVRETKPEPDEIVTQALTYPYHMVIVRSVDKEIMFDITK